MAERTDTKKKILDLGEELFLRGGYDGFSYRHISSTLGIKNAAVHYHYPSKAELGASVIRRARRRFGRWCGEVEANGGDAVKRLEALFGIFRNFLQAGTICFGGALAINFPVLPAEMQKEAHSLSEDFLTWTETVLREGRREGCIMFPGDPKDQAVVVLACIQGVLQIVRETEPSHFDAAVAQLLRSMKT
jgi:TetR/AcrR family transcriptional regulator, transcriptional repressor for nem operon